MITITANHEAASRERRAICILGMHRSGTSALARLLNILGVYLGEPDRLLAADDAVNPEGFWEHVGIMKCQDRLLHALGRTWYDPTPLPEGWISSADCRSCKDDLLSIIEEEFADKAIWGWKDPRTCLLLPMWDELACSLGLRIDYVMIVRNPLDVAASLSKRDAMLVDESLPLWLYYVLSALHGARRGRRCVVLYDRLLACWHEEMKRISGHLTIPWPSDEENIAAEVARFLKPTLRHASSSLEDLATTETNDSAVMETYRLCLNAVEDEALLESTAAIDKVNNLYRGYLLSQELIDDRLRTYFTNKNREVQLRIEELRLRTHQVKVLEGQIQDILNTVSWRITRPLRWAGERIFRSR